MARGTGRKVRGAPSAAQRSTPAVRIAVAAAVLAIGVSAEPAESGEAGTVSPDTARIAEPAGAAVNDLQRQVNELRSDLLDEREQRIVRWQESNGTVLVVLGIVIGTGGLWAYAKFRAIAVAAGTGMAAATGQAFASWDALPQPGTVPVSPGQAIQPVRLLVPAGPEPADPARIQHNVYPDGAVPESRQDREAVAECSEAIRLDPDHPHAWLERGDLKARQGQCEGAIADYDRAIRLDPCNAGAYLNRSLAKSEVGRHDEALADLDQVMRLDPDMASTLGDL